MNFRATREKDENLIEDFTEEREAGKKLQRWIIDPKAHCPTSRTDLTIQDLRNWSITESLGGLPEGCSAERMRCLGLPIKQYRIMHLIKKTTNFLFKDITTEWFGRAATGVLFIEDVRRDKGALDPQISELSIAAYRRSFPLDSLQHVFVTYIKNKGSRLVFKSLCPKDEVVVLEHGTPEYHALLGTPIGKVVAHLVLGAFDRGTRHIPRITLWWTGPRQSRAQAQFDIEFIHRKATFINRFFSSLVIEPRNSRRARKGTELWTSDLFKYVMMLVAAFVIILIDRYWITIPFFPF